MLATHNKENAVPKEHRQRVAPQQAQQASNWEDRGFLLFLNDILSNCLLRENDYNRLRQRLMDILKSDEFNSQLQAVGVEIDEQRLFIRPDVDVVFDLGEKQNVISLIQHIHPTWLRLGLEALKGEKLGVDLAESIVSALLRPVDAHKDMLRLGMKFMLLLDCAALEKLIPPSLFLKSSPVKSTSAWMTMFARNYMRGEADIMRHLKFFNYRLSYEQQPRDDFEWRLTNLATDLRDGIRLSRVVELLRGIDMTADIRMNASTRAHRLQNVKAVLAALEAAGMRLRDVPGILGGVKADHIVDGHRAATLGLLWSMTMNFSLPALLKVEVIQQETLFVRSTAKPSRAMDDSEADAEMRQQMYPASPMLSALLEWSATVCAARDVRVNNFTASFADGRAVCTMISFYVPWVLPLNSIRSAVDFASPEVIEQPSATGLWTKSFDMKRKVPPAQQAAKHNIDLLHKKVLEIGSVPPMLSIKTLMNTIPDEKVVITFVSHLFARLMELKHSFDPRLVVRAQAYARRYIAMMALKRIRLQRFVERVEAVTKAQTYIRGFLGRRRKQQLIAQAAARKEAVLCAAISLQAFARGRAAARSFQRTRKTVICCQSVVRMHFAVRQFKAAVKAVTVIQSAIRMHLAVNHSKKLQQQIVAMQSLIRKHLARKNFVYARAAAVKCQSAFRMFAHKKQFKQLRAAAVSIQTAVRGHQAATAYQQARTRIVKLQAQFRSFIARKAFASARSAVIKCQSLVRRQLQRTCYQQARKAVIALQSFARMVIAVAQYKKSRVAVTCVQSCIRRFLAMETRKRLQTIVNEKFAAERKAATLIQSVFKAHRASQAYKATRAAIVLCQAVVRKHNAMKTLRLVRAAVTRIQAQFRCFRDRRVFTSLRANIIVVQSVARRRFAVLWFQRETARIAAAGKIQQLWRARQAAKQYVRFRNSVVRSQSVIRCHQAAKLFKRIRSAVLLIQSCVRRHQTEVKFAAMQRVVIRCQSFVRRFIACRLLQSLKAERQALQLRQYTSAVTKVQSLVRRRQAIQAAAACRSAIVMCQAVARKHLAVVRFQHAKKCIVAVQARVRAHQAQLAFRKTVVCVVLVQALARRLVGKAMFKRRQRAAAIVRDEQAQQHAAIVIQKNVRTFLAKTHLRQAQRRIVLVQSMVRRFLAIHLRKTLQTAAKLKSSALDALLTNSSLHYVISACASLAISTKHSKTCCIRLVRDEQAVSVLLRLFHTLNRSKPAIELQSLTLAILSNLTNCVETRDDVLATKGVIEVLVLSVQLFYKDRMESLESALSILSLLTANARHAKIVTAMKEQVKKLQGARVLFAKKVDGDRKRVQGKALRDEVAALQLLDKVLARLK
eukprot:TRINITY_DN10222_c0_g1_i1.p1 TRINITY_DN10222_c0_g1~~TRINITY_DN10222_c0_g1_i1.p1  ORF type:complete len:1350 (+),score=396.93 TRINITY_DN10222_c0_g1_i1:43-4092(+)